MPRYSELKANSKFGSKYSLNRGGNLGNSYNDQSTGDCEFFTTAVHVSPSLQDSVKWFNEEKSKLVRSGKMFQDPFFSTDQTTLCTESLEKSSRKRIEWLRPKDIIGNPKFVVEGASRFDVRQGEIGDCWLLAALSSLSLYPELFNKVVLENQNFHDQYCGAFLFRFWRFGTWVDVVVDDQLPVNRAGNQAHLVYMHSTEGEEFWSALLEKAYAKLFSSYNALKGGSSSEAMEDFTGGITELFDLGSKAPENLWSIMMTGVKKFSLMGCSIEASPHEIETQASNGLIKGHAYSITDVKTVRTKRGEVDLVRVRNPWGNSCEWTGAWSDKSSEWSQISNEERSRLGLVFDDDGEFWMTFRDFVKHFTKLEICHLGPVSHFDKTASGANYRSKKASQNRGRWEMCLENGAWTRNVSAGGCRNFLQTFHMNPQFRVTVVDPDENDDDNTGTLIVGLMQRDKRSEKTSRELLTIGYAIYELKESKYDNSLLDTNYFRTHASIAKSPAFINMREVCGRHQLKPGKYVIVPSSFKPNEEAHFLVRIFSQKAHDSSQLDQKTEIVDPDWEKDLSPEEKQREKDSAARLKVAFDKIAGDDGELDAFELSQVLNSAFKAELNNQSKFSLETCRSLVAMLDIDQSGKMGFSEFSVLWNNLRLWKTIFKKFDNDDSGTFNVGELRQALFHIGFKVSNKIFTAICTRYSNRDGDIMFDDYILMVTRLRTVFLSYKSQRKTADNEAIFPQDDFMQCVLYM